MSIEKPILLEIPFPIITPHLRIVPVDPIYAVEFHAAKIESVEHLVPWMTWAADIGTLDDTREFMTRKKVEFLLRENLMLLAFTHEGHFVVATGLHEIDWTIPMAEIGYWCRKSALGQGYVTEASNAMARYAFEILKMRKITIAMDSENQASEVVPKRLNMDLEFEAAGMIKTLHPPSECLRRRKSYACFDSTQLPPLEVQWHV